MKLDNMEILRVAEVVAREKGIEKKEVIEAMELAIQKAGRTKYGYENDIRAHIDHESGEISLRRCREVVEQVENEAIQINLEDANKIEPALKIGELLEEPLPPIDFGRVAAQTARQVITQKVREVEREHQYEEFKGRVGEVINGLVKRVEFGNVIVDLGKAEGLLRREETIAREIFKVGDRARAYIADVRPDPHGFQIFLSRTHPQFMTKLFAQEVPEIYDNAIEVKSVARDAGSRAKIAVYTSDGSLDPVGACVGMRGSRVQAVVNEMQGEKIDIVLWSPDIATFVVNALAPAEVTKVVVEEEENRIIVIVPDDQLSLAIGRRGQNVRLATKLTGWSIDITTDSEDSKRRNEEMTNRSQLFIEALDIDDMIARLLVGEGFTTLEEIAYVGASEISAVEGFDEDLAQELQSRAKDYLEEQEKQLIAKYTELGVVDELVQLRGLTPGMLVALGENSIKTLDEFADLASDEVVEMLKSFKVTEDEANDLVMRARAHWYEDEHKVSEFEGEEITEVLEEED